MLRNAIAAAAIALTAGLAPAQCRVAAPTYQYTHKVVAPVVQVVIAHPVFNQVQVVTVTERQVLVPVIVTGQSITQQEVVTTRPVVVTR